VASLVLGLMLCLKVALATPTVFFVWRFFANVRLGAMPNAFAIANTIYLLVSGIFLIASGIDILRLHDWARRWTIRYVYIAWGAWAAMSVLFFVWLIPGTKATGKEKIYAVVSLAVCTLFVAAWGIAYLVLLRSRTAVTQFGNLLENDPYAPRAPEGAGRPAP
jgi:hypothetical protein